MVRRTSTRVGALVILGVVLVPLWFFLAPQQLGGSTAYVTTEGTSMTPLFHAGDLVVVRASSTYQVGDVVAYHSQELNKIVLHRIVAIDGEHYVFKGDSNTWVDSDRPTRDQLIGKMEVSIPGLGGRLHVFTTPVAISAAVGLGTVGLLGGKKRARRRKDRRKDRTHERVPTSNGNGKRPDAPAGGGFGGQAPVVGLSVLALLALALGAFAFVAPEEAPTHRDAIYEQEGSFSYTSVVPDGRAVYGTNVITTGDPVYLRLADGIHVAFDYRLGSPSPVEASGTAQLIARISDVDGWNRTLQLSQPTPFTGQEVTIRGVLDLAALRSMTVKLEQATGVQRDQYSVSLMPQIELDGTVAGQPLSKTFAPRLEFLLDDLELQMAPTQVPLPGEQATDPLNPRAGGLVTVEGVGPKSFAVFGMPIGIEWIRIGCLGAELFALVGLLIIVASRFRAARKGEPALIEARFGRWLVPVRGSAMASSRTVDVESFESLTQLATHYGQVILHEDRNGSHTYLVEDENVSYRYRVRTNGSRIPS